MTVLWFSPSQMVEIIMLSKFHWVSQQGTIWWLVTEMKKEQKMNPALTLTTLSANSADNQLNRVLTRILKQKVQRPQLTYLSEIATADMQMLCNTFPILSLKLMKGSSFEQFLVLKKPIVFFYCHYFTIYGHDSQWSVTIWTNSQSRFNSRISMKLGGNWPTDFWRESV